MIQILLDHVKILQGPNQTDCLVIAQSDQQKAWLESPALLTVLYGECKKAFPTATNMMIVSGSAYEFIAEQKAELIFSRITPP